MIVPDITMSARGWCVAMQSDVERQHRALREPAEHEVPVVDRQAVTSSLIEHAATLLARTACMARRASRCCDRRGTAGTQLLLEPREIEQLHHARPPPYGAAELEWRLRGTTEPNRRLRCTPGECDQIVAGCAEAMQQHDRDRCILRTCDAGGETGEIDTLSCHARTIPAGASHAAAMLEPDTDSFIVSVWTSLSRVMSVEIRQGDVLVRSARLAVGATQQAMLVVDGLTPSTGYQVTITGDDGALLGPHQVRTAPLPDDPRPVRLAVSADLDPSPEFASDLFDQIVAADPELFVTIGDCPYTDNGPVALTVDAYRARHAEMRTEPRVRTWMQAMGMRAIYDDHEFRNNWDASFVASEASRYAAAMQVWDEFYPLPNAVGDVRYRNWRWGANVEHILLDCRRFRSADADPDTAAKTMIGATQQAWLLDVIAKSTATFKLIFTSIPLDFGNGNDHWATFTTERDAIFDAIHAMQTSGVLFVSGDQHYFAAYRHAYGIREFQVGPLSRGLGTVGPTGPGVLFRDVRYNFGLIDIDHDSLTFSGVGPGGDVFYKETLTVADLTPA